ncbi:hypothetical protein ABB02_00333 [Clostridiaceae bacterium JG1575]|nr:hypothetical protein ABB02_00333 [Clostridiaceae bacterium JG1575]
MVMMRMMFWMLASLGALLVVAGAMTGKREEKRAQSPRGLTILLAGGTKPYAYGDATKENKVTQEKRRGEAEEYLMPSGVGPSEPKGPKLPTKMIALAAGAGVLAVIALFLIFGKITSGTAQISLYDFELGVQLSGTNGEGTAMGLIQKQPALSSYGAQQSKVKEVLDTAKVEVSKTSGLKNGDVLTLRLSLDHDLARSRHVTIVGEAKGKIEVKGLATEGKPGEEPSEELHARIHRTLKAYAAKVPLKPGMAPTTDLTLVEAFFKPEGAGEGRSAQLLQLYEVRLIGENEAGPGHLHYLTVWGKVVSDPAMDLDVHDAISDEVVKPLGQVRSDIISEGFQSRMENPDARRGQVVVREDKVVVRIDTPKQTKPSPYKPQDPAAKRDFILPWSTERLALPLELAQLTNEELILARNEIFARHHRRFTDEELRRYFSSKSWYQGRIDAARFNEGVLNSVEKENIKRILEEERRR